MSAVLKLVCDNPVSQKACTKCGVVKDFSCFDKTKKTSTGFRAVCKECRHTDYRNARGNDADKRNKVVLIEGGRVCMSCNVGKTWDQFAKEKIGFNQKTSSCIPCRREKFNEQYKKNPAVRRSGIKDRPDRILKQYGITFADVLRTYDEQHGKCANHACSREITLETKTNGHGMKNKAMIDHNHTTGKFRALLCMQCNLTLGYLEKQENIILGLQDYLTKHINKGS